MSYYASFHGNFIIDDMEFVSNLPYNVSEFPSIHREEKWNRWDSFTVSKDGGGIRLSFSEYERFNEEIWNDWLDEFAPHFKSGSVEFIGEDNCMWRYIVDHTKPTHWREDAGEPAYNIGKPLSIERKLECFDALLDHVTAWLENCEAVEVLRKLGFTDSDIEMCGFLIPEVETSNGAR